MKRNNIFTIAITACAVAFAMSSCDKSKTQTEATTSSDNKVVSGETKIAYVEVDSIMSNYKFCKDYSLILQKKGQNIQNTLEAKQRQLQAAAANFQQKIQQNAYTREQAQAIEMGLQKQQNDLQVLNQRLTNEFQVETDKYNKALRDSIQHFLAEYNKDKKFALILSKAGDNILYANKSYDITKDVIAGLNKAYKPSANIEKKEDKK